jgi:hypothetical protein
MTESLQKIAVALAKHAPTIGPGKRAFCADFIDAAMVFNGRRLSFLVSESLDGFCELFVRQKDDEKERPCWLLRHEKWHTVAKVMILLESNHVAPMQTSDPIALRDRSGCTDTVIDPLTC